MKNLEQRPRSPYRQFAAGNNLCFTLNKLRFDGSVEAVDYHTEVQAIRGGGFFGKVLILKDSPFVLKTAIPDPIHDFLRRINWGLRDFPYQVNKLDAQLGYLTTNLIHEAVTTITDGRFYAPVSFGYTRLPGTFAQAVERLHGRPPRYDNGQNEFRQFKQAQAELAEIAYGLGLEHVGQIHPRNPFAMANIWFNPNLSRWEWFDTLPAIPHNKWIWPVYHFGFHTEIRKTFYPDTKTVTFDRIHTARFRAVIEAHRNLFNDAAYESVQHFLSLYEELRNEKEYKGKNPRNFKGLIYAGKGSLVDVSRSIAGKTKETVVTPIKILTDPDYVNGLALEGLGKAFDTGIITEDDLREATSAVQFFSSQDRGRNRFWRKLGRISLWPSLYFYYVLSSGALKFPEVAAYALLGLTSGGGRIIKVDLAGLTTQGDSIEKLATAAGVFVGFRVAGALNSYLFTRALGFVAKRNLNTAARISAIPLVGMPLAMPSQICADVGSQSEAMRHYSIRNIVAKISKINPAGGWGSEFEGKLWNMFGKRLEGLADNRRSKSLNKRLKDRFPDKFLAIFHH